MGKRSNYPRRARDFYQTPPPPILAMRRHIKAGSTYADPCAGDNRMAETFASMGVNCVFASDICPQYPDIEQMDALDFDALKANIPTSADYIITNPPWSRTLLHPMITNFASLKPTWLLFDANWANTQQALPYKRWCKKIVPVKRVSWMGNGQGGMDDAAWYFFDKTNTRGTKFYWVTA